MRVLIVGGGIAGLTLAAKLGQQGRAPLVVEKAAAYGEAGYGIGLYPLGACVFQGFGLYDELRSAALPMARYVMHDGTGQPMQDVDMRRLLEGLGDGFLLARTALVDLLRKAAAGVEIRMGTSVAALEQSSDVVRVRLSDGRELETDLVVAADGIHSSIRMLLLGNIPYHDTGWLVRSWWGRRDLLGDDAIHEFWGNGSFVGCYSTPGRTNLIVGGPARQAPAHDAPVDTVRDDLLARTRSLTRRVPAVAEAIESATAFLPWPMVDVRAPSWYVGRVALCGDAGTAFLPTAGVGASNALRAAAALGDELSRAGAATVPHALTMWEKRARHVVEQNQDDSRSLARVMFVEGAMLAAARNLAMEHYPIQRLAKQIRASMLVPF